MSAAASTVAAAVSSPTTFLSSVKTWLTTSASAGQQAEETLLKTHMTYFKTAQEMHENPPSTGELFAASSMEPLETSVKSKRYLNCLQIGKAGVVLPDEQNVIMMHGYGAGLAFFFLNYDSLAQVPNTRIWALDWLGLGRSSRPPFSVKGKDTLSRVAQSESFFVDSLEQWRIRKNLEKMILVGHSLGGYLATAYSLKYPERVKKLILVSPVGIPENPYESSPGSSQDGINSVGATLEQAELRSEVKRMNDTTLKSRPPMSNAQRLFYHLWDKGWSPFTILRSSLWWGPMLVRYTERRFSSLPPDQRLAMHTYLYTVSVSKGSGEYSLSHILAPGAFARLPLVNRISALKMPITFMYGETDWMDVNGGKDSVKRLAAAGNTDCQVLIVPKAGHHLYLDNPSYFNLLMQRELEGQSRTSPALHDDGRES